MVQQKYSARQTLTPVSILIWQAKITNINLNRNPANLFDGVPGFFFS